MRLLTRFVLPCIALALLAAWIALPRLLDRSALRDSLTAQLSTALGRPVSIDRLDLRLAPQPTVVIDHLTTSLSDHADDRLAVDRLSMLLSIPALLERRILISRLELAGLTLNPRLIASLRATLAALNRGTAGTAVAVRLQQVQVTDLNWTAPDGMRLGPYSVRLDWADGAIPQRVAVTHGDSHAQADLYVKGDTIGAHVQAQAWKTPVREPLRQSLHIDRLESHTRYTAGRLEILDLNFAGPLGTLHLHGVLDWRTARRFTGKLSGAVVDLPLLLAAFGQQAITGKADGACDVDLHADDAASLRRPRLDCSVRHTQGEHRADIRLVTRPQADALQYELHASHLRLPVGPPLQFATLDLRGDLRAGQITFAAAHATSYAGELEFPGRLTWESGWQWTFAAHGRQLRLDPLLAVFDRHNLDGRLDADCDGKLAGPTAAALFAQPHLRCDFAIADGVLRRTDLEQAARLFKSASKTAGNTPFDRLSGRLLMQSGQSRFTGMKLRSTALEASGGVTIAADRRLSGEVNAGLKNTGGMVSVPLVVSGSMDDPVLRPTTSAMAGGAAGTVLLGPGVGTAVGVKVGEALGRMTRWLQPKGGAAPDDRQE